MSGYQEALIKDWADLCDRILAHKEGNNEWPEFALIGDAKPNMDEVFDSCLRVGRWLNKNGMVLPNYVRIGTKPVEQQVQDDGWMRSNPFTYDPQDTSSWCAPASLSMATDETGAKQVEATLAKLFGTGDSGTSHSQIKSGMNKIGYDVEEVWVKDMDLNRLGQIAKSPTQACIPHIQLLDNTDYKKSMCYDWTGNKLYLTYRGGHYLFNSAVNPSRNLVLNADPSRGLQYVWWDQLWYGCRYTEINLGVSGFLVIKKR
jgi:hypothetical protein